MTRTLVTVRTLVEQVRTHGRIELPADALITPAARDWLRGTHLRVATRPASASGPPTGPVVYFVGDARQPDVQTLLPTLERSYPRLRFLPYDGQIAGLLAAVRAACAGLSECSQRRGVVLVSDGAPVCCLANRFAGVRAAILAAPSALFGLIRALGVNLLILERPRMSLAQIRAAITSFVAGRPSIAPEIAAALAATGGTSAACGEAPALVERFSGPRGAVAGAAGALSAGVDTDGDAARPGACPCSRACAGGGGP